mmetsp:Transcript_24597/g.64233  ORF Transcript_24597/g.64233 Transcript_24597/m.64233 type:complete len:151 (-) Transcript_24597:49-501(-)
MSRPLAGAAPAAASLLTPRHSTELRGVVLGGSSGAGTGAFPGAGGPAVELVAPSLPPAGEGENQGSWNDGKPTEEPQPDEGFVSGAKFITGTVAVVVALVVVLAARLVDASASTGHGGGIAGPLGAGGVSAGAGTLSVSGVELVVAEEAG